MKTPPFLLLAALLFWGWQTGFLLEGAIMGLLLESARFTRFRWDLDDTDFNRIWTFCIVLNIALAGYCFTSNDQGGGFHGLVHGHIAQNVVNSGVVTTTRFLRWLPLTFFAFIGVQIFNMRESVPLTAVSLVLRWRRRWGDSAFRGYYLNISYPYLLVCLFSAGIHTNHGEQTYFWGLCALVAWALWAMRPARFGIFIWLVALMIVTGVGFSEVKGINAAQRVIQRFNAQWIAKFLGRRTDPTEAETSIGQIGRLELSPKIVIWLQPEELGRVPTYLREASYRIYFPKHERWFAGGSRNDFDMVHPEADNTTWVLVTNKSPNAATVNIACYLNGRSSDGDPEGVLPLPSGTRRLENLPASAVVAIQKNPTGAVLAIGAGLQIFDARFAPGATLDAPPDTTTNKLDLGVPESEISALKKVIAEMNTSSTDSETKILLTVQKFFADKFTYSLWQGLDKRATTNASPLTKFLLTSRSGHCEYFATATVLLLRELGIPARYAVGYYVHEPSGSGYIVRERDAHAWCLVWNRAKKTWEDFDTTPSSWVAMESAHTSFWEWLSDMRSWLGLQIEKFRWRQAHLQQYILWALIPVLVVLLYHIIFRRDRKRRRLNPNLATAEKFFWPGLDSEFYRLERALAARGVPRQPGESLSDWLERALAANTLAELRPVLWELLRLHYRLRFDPHGLSLEERTELKQKAATALDKVSSLASSP